MQEIGRGGPCTGRGRNGDEQREFFPARKMPVLALISRESNRGMLKCETNNFP